MNGDRDLRALTRAQILSWSSRLREPGFAGVYESYLSAENVLLVVDCDAEVGAADAMRRHRELVAALTPEQVIVLRGRGAIGIRTRWKTSLRAWIIDLRTLVELRVTSQGDLCISYTHLGQVGLLTLLFRSRALADSWMSMIDDAFWMPK
jgi:hypothetical protein